MTSAPAVDLRAHRAVIEALLKTALNSDHVYAYGKVPGHDGNAGTEPAIYALLGFEGRPTDPRRAGLSGQSAWRAIVTVAGRTVAELEWALWQVAVGLDEQRVTVDGHTSTRLQGEVPATAPVKDGARFFARAEFTYVL